MFSGREVFPTRYDEKSFSFDLEVSSARPFSCSRRERNSRRARFSLFDSTERSCKRLVNSITLWWLFSLSFSMK
jgi:hypothetical protein